MTRVATLQSKPGQSQPAAAKPAARPSAVMRSPRAPGGIVSPWAPPSPLPGAVPRFRSSAPAAHGQVQAKLEVSDPGDALEIEAERVADEVMRMHDPGRAVRTATGRSGERVDRACAACAAEHELQRTESGGAGEAVAPPI